MVLVENPEGPQRGQRGIDLDQVLAEEVGLGWYQLRTMLMCGLVAFCYGLPRLHYIFTAQRIRTRCLIPECEAEIKQDFSPSWIANAVPASGQSLDGCRRFAPAPSARSPPSAPGSCPAGLFDNGSLVQCTEYVYEHNNSAVYEFGLACDEWRWFAFGAAPALGTMAALPLTGAVADRAGRRVALTLNVVSYACLNVLSSFTTSYTTYIITIFFAYMFGGAALSCVYVIALEQVEPKLRMIVGFILKTCSCLGLCCLGLVASAKPYWRHFLLMIYLPLFFGVSFFWIAPESVRWLMSKNRFKESKAILIKAAEMNGKVLSEETLKSFSDMDIHSKKEQSIKQNHEPNLICILFRQKTILFHFVLNVVWHLTQSFVNNSLVISSVTISGNKFSNHVVVAAVPIPACWLTLLVVDRAGRKPTLFTGYLIGGACLLAFIFVPKEYYGISLSLYLLGRSGMAALSIVLGVYALELFPTRYRTRLLTCSSMAGHLGEVVAPLTPALAAGVWEFLPFALFGGLALLSALLVLPAPETRGRALPDSWQDAADLGRAPPARGCSQEDVEETELFVEIGK